MDGNTYQTKVSLIENIFR